jgi:glycerol-3-phosphate dehydrogenase (NAD(P)+)
MRLSVLGAGAWGTAVAIAAGARHEVCLWARDPDHARRIAEERANTRYLPGVALPPALGVVAELDAALAHAPPGREGLIVIATPTAGLRSLLAWLPPDRPVAWLCKGFEFGSGRLAHEVALEVRGGHAAPVAVVSGPSFADEVARGQPTALVVASADAGFAGLVQAALHGEALRCYTTADVVGVEVGGAVKNVLAIACGLLDGLAEAAPAGGPPAPGLNARAALITRGLAEMTRLGVALGARAETFMGLSGLGDLVLTATGALSRNRRVGLALASGRALPEVLAQLGHVAEGVPTAATVRARAAAIGVRMPIVEAVADVLDGRAAPREAMAALMARQARTES